MVKKISPKISSVKWGEIITDDGNRYKDAKLFPGGSGKWNWNETGTHHTPGIQPDDIKELLEHDAEIIVLSQGFYERLQVSDNAKQFLNQKNIPFYILETSKAAQKYNALRETQKVGALIHSTC
jgi:hypothetical protein